MKTQSVAGVTANAEFAAALDRHHLWNFERWWELAEAGQIVRDLRPGRFTARVDLTKFPGMPPVAYIKCHGRPSWKERWKAWSRLAPLAWGSFTIVAVVVDRNGVGTGFHDANGDGAPDAVSIGPRAPTATGADITMPRRPTAWSPPRVRFPIEPAPQR
mgnify:CR=1 FL=1